MNVSSPGLHQPGRAVAVLPADSKLTLAWKAADSTAGQQQRSSLFSSRFEL